MAADTAQLIVSLEARFDRLEKSLRDAGVAAERGVDSIERKFRDANPRFETAGYRLGQSLTIGFAQGIGQDLFRALNPAALLARLREVGTEIERIQRIGEETRLGAGNIRGLEFAAVGAGVEQSTLTTALRRFAEVSKQTREEAAELYTALSRIGPAFANQFANAPTQVERFNVLQRAFRATTDEVKIAQLATQVFSTDSERLTGMVRSTSDGLEGFTRAAERAGLTVNNALIERAAAATRAFNQFSAALNDTLSPALMSIYPLLLDIARVLTSIPQAIGDLYQLTLPVERRTTQSLEEQIADGERLVTQLREMREMAGRLRNVDTFPPSTMELNAQRRVEENRAELERRSRLVVTVPAGAFRPRPSLAAESESETARTAFDRAIESQERATVALRAETEAAGLTETARQRLLLVRRLETIAVQANTQAGETNTAVTAAQRTAIDAAAAAYLRAAENLERLRTSQRQSLELQRFLGQEMVSSISGLVAGTASLADVVGKLAQKLADAALQAALLGEGPLAGLLGVGPSNRPGVAGGLIGSLAQFLFPKAAFAGFIGGAKMAGGPVEGGTPYLVGEGGPELFVPGRSGMIVPNAALRGAPPGMALTMINDFRGADPGSEARIMLKLQQLRLEVPGLVVKTVQTAQQNRVLR